MTHWLTVCGYVLGTHLSLPGQYVRQLFLYDGVDEADGVWLVAGVVGARGAMNDPLDDMTCSSTYYTFSQADTCLDTHY